MDDFGAFVAPQPVYLDPNQQAVQSNVTVTTNGNAGPFVGYGAKEVDLVINITGTVSGTTPTIQYTLSEVDPGNQTTVLSSKTGTVLNATGVQILTLPRTTSGVFLVSWVVTGSTPSFGGVYSTITAKYSTGVQGTPNTLANAWPVIVTDLTNTMPTMDAVGRAGFQKITDGVNTAAVKASTVAAQTTDPALVVALSPNSNIVKAQLQDNAGNGLTSTLISGKQALDVNIADGTFNINVGVNDKTSFTYGTTTQLVIGGVYQDTSPTLTAGTSGAVRLTQYRAQHVNIRDSSGNEKLGSANSASSIPVVIASDQAAVSVSQSTSPWVVAGNAASGATDSGSPVKVGGVYNSTLPTLITGQRGDLQLDANARLIIAPLTTASVIKSELYDSSGNAFGLVGNAVFVKTTDGSNTAAVKAASTAVAATDPALAVSLSPNSPTPVGPDTVGSTGNLGGPNQQVVVALAGQQSCSMALPSGTLIGTITPGISYDGGTNWIDTAFEDANTGAVVPSITFGSNNFAAFKTILIYGGASHARVRVSSFTSGTTTCSLRATMVVDQLRTARLFDGATYAVIKVGSTAAAATDPALVVAISPNNTVGVTESGTFTVQPGNTPNTTPWLVTDSSDGPVGAGTAAGKSSLAGLVYNSTLPTLTTGQQAALQGDVNARLIIVGAGTAGIPAGGVVSIQGVTSGIAVGVTVTNSFALDSSVNGILLAQGSTTTGEKGPLIQGAVSSTAPSYTNAQTSPLSINLSGDLRTITKVWDGTNIAAVKGASTAPTALDPAIVVALSPNSGSIGTVNISADQQSGFNPDPHNIDTGVSATLHVDASNNLEIRGPVLTDEGSLRDDFSGNSITVTLTGTVTFTNGSPIVTGSGTTFTTQVINGSQTLSTDYYVKVSAQSETFFVRIASIDSDTQLTLASAYGGATASGTTAVASLWATTTASSGGGAISVSSSAVSLVSGTTSGNVQQIAHLGDYLPYNLICRANISQRIVNQTSIVGFQDNPTSPQQQACVVFNGTSNNTIIFRTSFSSAEVQDTTVTLPSGLNTSQTLRYQIDLSAQVAVLSINGNIVAINADHLPSPYTVTTIVGSITNSATVTTTTLAIDLFSFQNLDQIQTTNSFTGEPFKVQVITGASTSTGLGGFTFGDVTTASNNQVPVIRTTYTEQASNAQRSFVSSSAQDAAGGTGIKTLAYVYYDSTGNGPFIEVVALNGTTPVNTVNTNVCFIEQIIGITAGSGQAAAGIISMKAATGGTGATIWSIGTGDTQTFGSHHYVSIGKTCNITAMSVNHNGTTVGSGALFLIKAIAIGVTNALEREVSDFHRLYGQSSTAPRPFGNAIQVVGPARITLYVAPETTSSTTYRGTMDLYDV